MKKAIWLFVAMAALLICYQRPCEADDHRRFQRQHSPRVYQQHRPVPARAYQHHRPAPRYHCPPPGHVYRHYHFRHRWYYYGPYCGGLISPVIVVPLPVVGSGYFVDVQCTVCKRWWRWRPEYPGQTPEGLPPCWQYH